MAMSFEHATLGQRMLFGTGKAAEHVAAELERLGASRPMVIASASQRGFAKTATSLVTPVLWWDEVVMHVPVEVAERARAAAGESDADVLVSVGGGSTTGLAKAVALTTGIPVVAIPTTYAGSEATNVWGLTEDRTKTTGVDDKVLPVTVIYDAELSKTLPVDLSVASGLNGLAHCVDSLWAPRTDPINQALALEGARALALALRGIVADADDMDAREQALYGCYLAAVSFVGAGSGLHHKICHVLGGTFDLPHAQTHATVLPYVLELNAPAVPELAGRLAAALGGDVAGDPAAAAVNALRELYEAVDAPSRLADYGFTAAGVPEAVERVLKAAPASNPVAVTEQNMTELLTAALNGERAQSEAAELSGGGVVLRHFRESDADDLLATCQDAAVLEWTQVPVDYTRDMALEWCNQAPGTRWVITVPDGSVFDSPARGRFMGQIELRVHNEHYVSVGYMTAPWARGRGLMTEAVRLLTEWALERGAARVELCVHPDNAASRRVAEKAGFTNEGVRRNGEVLRGEVRDLVVYSAIP